MWGRSLDTGTLCRPQLPPIWKCLSLRWGEVSGGHSHTVPLNVVCFEDAEVLCPGRQGGLRPMVQPGLQLARTVLLSLPEGQDVSVGQEFTAMASGGWWGSRLGPHPVTETRPSLVGEDLPRIGAESLGTVDLGPERGMPLTVLLPGPLGTSECVALGG